MDKMSNRPNARSMVPVWDNHENLTLAPKTLRNADYHYSLHPSDHDATARPVSRDRPMADLGASPKKLGYPGGEATSAGVKTGPVGATGGTVKAGSKVRTPASVTL